MARLFENRSIPAHAAFAAVAEFVGPQCDALPVLCDICGREMSLWPADSLGQGTQVWSCPWCYATTSVKQGGAVVSRLPYAPIDQRWESALSYLLPDEVDHAYGYHHQTLCGIQHRCIQTAPWFWFPDARNACAECAAVAREIDGRWPPGLRGADDRKNIGDLKYKSWISRTDWSDSPEDQIGRPDLRLDDIPPSSYLVPASAAVQTGSRRDTSTAPDGRSEALIRTGWRRMAHLGAYGAHLDARGYVPIASLPALSPAAFTGGYEWLGDLGYVIDFRLPQVEGVRAELAEHGLDLPADLVTLATRENPQSTLDSSPCYLGLSMSEASPLEPDARMIRFLREHVSCDLWYLYLRPSGESFVVHSTKDFTRPVVSVGDTDPSPAEAAEQITWCASSIEQFAYRYWAEHTVSRAIWRGQRIGELPADASAYLAVCVRQREGSLVTTDDPPF